MDGTLAVFLRKLYQEGRQHDEPLADRLSRLRNMTPAASSLISLLIRAQGSRDVLEIGTSNGYSAIWFADALRDTGGKLVSVETEPSRVEAARENLARAGVGEYAEVLHGDGGQVLAGAGDASLDLVVLDAERPAYEGYWPDLRRVLRPHGIVAVDNAVSHGEQLTGFRGLLEDDPSFVLSLQRTGDGVLTAVRTEV